MHFPSSTLHISEMQGLPQVDQETSQASVTHALNFYYSHIKLQLNYSAFREDRIYPDMVLSLCMSVYSIFYFYIHLNEEHTSSLSTLRVTWYFIISAFDI